MDRYTKGLLTVIAASFAVLAWRAIDPAPVPVALVDCNYGISDPDRWRFTCPRAPVEISFRGDLNIDNADAGFEISGSSPYGVLPVSVEIQ